MEEYKKVFFATVWFMGLSFFHQSQIGQEQSAKDKEHAYYMGPGKIFMQNKHGFQTAEYRYEISKQGGSTGSQYVNRNIPDKKTNNGSTDTEI